MKDRPPERRSPDPDLCPEAPLKLTPQRSWPGGGREREHVKGKSAGAKALGQGVTGIFKGLEAHRAGEEGMRSRRSQTARTVAHRDSACEPRAVRCHFSCVFS